MAVVNMNFKSEYLNGNTEISVVLPNVPKKIKPARFYESGEKYKVLWLLHGSTGDHSDYIRKSMIEVFACERNLIVVCPSALNSKYSNWEHCVGNNGYFMQDYFFFELMPMIYNWFPASNKREDNFITGLSMGGGGTLKYALTYPEKFAAACMMSNPPFNLNGDGSALEGGRFLLDVKRQAEEIRNAGGLEAYQESYDNAWRWLDRLMPTGKLPRMYFCSGTADFGYQEWVWFRKHAEEKAYDCTFETIEGYGHEWRYWNICLEKALDFFGIKVAEPQVDRGNHT